MSFINKIILPILLIFKFIILYKWYEYNNLKSDFMISKIKTSYINNNIILKFL